MNTGRETYQVGDIVRLDEYSGTKAQRALVWRVTGVLPGNNYRITPVTGGLPLGAPAIALIPGSDADRAAAVGAVEAVMPNLGAVVTTINVRNADGHNMVVIGVNADRTVKLAKLGGAENRIWNKVPISRLVVVDLSAILA